MTDNLEYRNFSGLKSANTESDGKLRITGYFSVFNSDSHPIPTRGGEIFIETIDRNAFESSLKAGQDIRALAFHDINHVLGRTKNGTLKLTTDDHGLFAEVILPDTQFARDLHKSISEGYIDEASFGFRVKKDDWEERSDGSIHRKILDVDLKEVSVVAAGAYGATAVQARSYDQFKEEIEEQRKKEQAARLEVEIAALQFIIDNN